MQNYLASYPFIHSFGYIYQMLLSIKDFQIKNQVPIIFLVFQVIFLCVFLPEKDKMHFIAPAELMRFTFLTGKIHVAFFFYLLH